MKNKFLFGVVALSAVLISCKKGTLKKIESTRQKQETAINSESNSDLKQVVRDYFERKIAEESAFETGSNRGSLKQIFIDDKSLVEFSNEVHVNRNINLKEKTVYCYTKSEVKNINVISKNEKGIIFTVEWEYFANTNKTSFIDGTEIPISTSGKDKYLFNLEKDKNGDWRIKHAKNTAFDLLKNEAANLPAGSIKSYDFIKQESSNLKISTATYVYNRVAVANYCRNYAMTFNSYYPLFTGSDCTNFASQCLKAGGWPNIAGSYSNPRAWNFTKVAGRNVFSHTWIAATKFADLLYYTPSRAIAQYTSAFGGLQVGDVISVDFGVTGSVGHNIVVSAKDIYGNLYISCHSTNRYNKSLNLYIAESAPLIPQPIWYPWKIK